MSILQMRLKNCVQTILEAQPSFRQVYRNNFAEDFNYLKAWLPRIDAMDLKEEDVERIEDVTSEFLREARYAGCRAPQVEMH